MMNTSSSSSPVSSRCEQRAGGGAKTGTSNRRQEAGEDWADLSSFSAGTFCYKCGVKFRPSSLLLSGEDNR